MKYTFTKRDLHSGDIIESRNGERGVVVLEKDCIVYQAGGLDELEIFTDDLFIDGPQREGDIFKVFHDPNGPLGFNKLFGLKPVFARKDNEATKKRAEELNDRYDKTKGCVTALVFEPCYRRCEETHISALGENIDLVMSEAPSMTVCGQLKIDRTFIPIPQAESLFVVYNRYQEKWHLENVHRELSLKHDATPIVIIPEMNLRIHSRCMLVRMGPDNKFENLRDSDCEIIRNYLNEMK